MRRNARHLLGITLFILSAWLAPVRAQGDWSTAASGTTQNLWGIAPGAGQFVVVGEGGVVLTSPDGATWTARASGTTRWLLAVAYAADLQRWVIVGDAGLVLTSPDTITWTPRTSGTPQRLNGVAYGNGRFLAVGEGGVVCTSTDGLAWTARTAPTTGWLRGVVQGDNRFLIAGQANGPDPSVPAPAKLFVTTDGVNFTTAADGLTLATDLEALAFDGTQFAAAGDGLSFASAASSLGWRVRVPARANTPFLPFRYFRGVTFFNNAWVAVGTVEPPEWPNASPITYGHPDATLRQDARGVNARASLNAIASTAATAVAVGAGGTIVRAAATQSAPAPFLISPSSVVATAGGSAQLVAAANGSAPLSYQWSRDGRPIAGATQPTLTLTGLTFAQSGSYTLTATNPLGAATSTPLTLAVLSPLAVSAPVDPGFVAAITGEPNAFVVQADGRVVVNAPTTATAGGATPRFDLVRLTSNGAIDATFQSLEGIGRMNLLLQPDQKILLREAISSAGTTRLSRRLPDGAPDASFNAIEHFGPVIPLADGRVLLARFSNNVLTITRYNGSANESSYSFAPLTLGIAAGNAFDPSYSTLLSASTADGRIVVAVVSYAAVGTGTFGRNETKFFRLLADGTLDPSFPLTTLPEGVIQIASVGDKIVTLSVMRRDLGSVASYRTGRLNADGRADATYRTVALGGGLPVFPTVTLAADGSLTFIAGRAREIVRYDPDGVLDPEFSARFSPAVTFPRVVVHDSGQFFVAGNFTQLNGAGVPYLARLLPDTRASATRLTNLSIRQFAGTGSQTLIAGFVIAGEGSKPMLLRGVGPALASFNVASPLPDPRLTVFTSAGASVLANDNWSDHANASAVASTTSAVGAFALPAGSRDASALTTLSAGAFTLQIAGNGATGIALAEGYDAGPAPESYRSARVINFSARATAGSGDATLIAGFTLAGPNVKRVLIRGVGPTLTRFGLSDVLPDPRITVFSGTTPIASNDDWGSATELVEASTAVGAFPLGSSVREAVLLLTLPPGSYTVQLTDANPAATGVALIEIYEVP